MSKNRYTHAIDSIKVPQDAIDRALDAVYDNTPELKIEVVRTQSHGKFRLVPAVAAVLAAVILAGGAALGIALKPQNSFYITANAAEINSVDEVRIGELKSNNNAVRIAFDSPDKVYYLAQCKTAAFPVICNGNNIDKITYAIDGNGYLAVRENAQGVSDLEYVPDVPDDYYEAEKYPYNIADTEDYSIKVKSFSQSYETQSETTAMLGLFAFDENAEYCRRFSSEIQFDNESGEYHQGKDFDFEDMYYNLFRQNNYSVDITVTFKDSSTQTKTLLLGIEKAESNETEERTPLVITAKLVEK